MGKITKDSLGDRMKQYEAVNDRILVPKMPFIIRVDGKAFHTYTRGLKKPFDKLICDVMREVTAALCKDIPGAVLGYTQSDEITVVCRYTDRIVSQAWFNGRVRKIETIAASKATKYFNKYFIQFGEKYIDNLISDALTNYGEVSDELEKYITVIERKQGMAEFDARVFNLPEWDCINNVIWRQQDAIRNSIEAVGQANFSAKELHKITCEGIKEKLLNEKGISWENDFTPYQKSGALCYKVDYEKEIKGAVVHRTKWQCKDDETFIVQDNREKFAGLTGLSED